MLILVLIAALLGGWVSRMCGGGWPKLSWGLDQWIYAFPYGILGVVFGGPVGGVISLLFAFLGKRTGHGQWFDLGTWTGIVKPEKLDFIVSLVFGPDPNTIRMGPGYFLRDYFGLAVSGIFVALGLGGVLLWQGYGAEASIVLLGGAVKPVGYHIGKKLCAIPDIQRLYALANKSRELEFTEVGEYLTGFFGWGSVMLAWGVALGNI